MKFRKVRGKAVIVRYARAEFTVQDVPLDRRKMLIPFIASILRHSKCGGEGNFHHETNMREEEITLEVRWEEGLYQQIPLRTWRQSFHDMVVEIARYFGADNFAIIFGKSTKERFQLLKE